MFSTELLRLSLTRDLLDLAGELVVVFLVIRGHRRVGLVFPTPRLLDAQHGLCFFLLDCLLILLAELGFADLDRHLIDPPVELCRCTIIGYPGGIICSYIR